MNARSRDRIVAIADAHMAAGVHDLFAADDRLETFLAGLSADAPKTTLLILGDLLDFSRVETPGKGRLETGSGPAREKLARIAESHGGVFERLRELLAAGGQVELVPGNHDLELLLPPVWQRFHELLGGDGELHLSPWLFHVPGVVLAEHGQQHHEPNRVPDLLLIERGDAAPVPPGTRLSEFGLARGEGSTLGAAGSLAAGLATAARRRRPSSETFAAEERRTGISTATLQDLHGLGPDRPASAAGRLAGRLARERFGRTGSSPYMEQAVRRVHRVLRDRGVATPLYVTGHTHVAVDVPLGDGARYLNPGTWSTLRPASAPPGFHYVEIAGPGDAALRTWEG